MFKELLSKYNLDKLVTINQFLNTEGVTLGDLKQYNYLLSKEPKRTDFINYDDKGLIVLGNKPVFKGWRLCKDTSADINKVAKLITVGNSYKIYFMTANGVTIISLENMCDRCTYNDIAIFFDGNLELN